MGPERAMNISLSKYIGFMPWPSLGRTPTVTSSPGARVALESGVEISKGEFSPNITINLLNVTLLMFLMVNICVIPELS